MTKASIAEHFYVVEDIGASLVAGSIDLFSYPFLALRTERPKFMRWAPVFHVPLCAFRVHVPPADCSDIFGTLADDVSAEITDEARLFV